VRGVVQPLTLGRIQSEIEGKIMKTKGKPIMNQYELYKMAHGNTPIEIITDRISKEALFQRARRILKNNKILRNKHDFKS